MDSDAKLTVTSENKQLLDYRNYRIIVRILLNIITRIIIRFYEKNY